VVVLFTASGLDGRSERECAVWQDVWSGNSRQWLAGGVLRFCDEAGARDRTAWAGREASKNSASPTTADPDRDRVDA
jgi:hypothetical protein